MSFPILFTLIICVFFLILVLIRPNIATLVVLFLIYTNIPVILKKSLDLPELLAGSFVAILAIPLAFYLFIRREKMIIDVRLILMSVLLVISIISALLFAVDFTIALNWIMIFILEGMLLYFLLTNIIRDFVVLKQVIWVLLLACSLLGSLSLVQDITRSYDNDFFHLAQRAGEEDIDRVAEKMKLSRFQRSEVGKVSTVDRSAGPIGGPNRYAQIMIVILPLALSIFVVEGSRLRKFLAASAGILILSGILLSFSRGAFISLIIIGLLLTFLGAVRLRHTISLTLVLLFFMVFAAPGYLARVGTIGGVETLASKDTKTEGAIAGRTTEMLAALNVFRDHPILGVGPGQYLNFYSVKYQTKPSNAYRYLNRKRRAHSLYAEIPAELGLLGFVAFMAIALVTMHQLWQIRRSALPYHPEFASISLAFFVSIVAFLSTSIFLHFAFQRYYWLLLAVAGASIQIFTKGMRTTTS